MALIIALVNQSNLAATSDYTYEVLIGDGSASRSKTIARGAILGHIRSDGWRKLIQMLLDKESIRDKALVPNIVDPREA